MIDLLQSMIHEYNQQHEALHIHVAVGYSCLLAHETIAEMLKRADQIMYLDKQDFYQARVQ